MGLLYPCKTSREAAAALYRLPLAPGKVQRWRYVTHDAGANPTPGQVLDAIQRFMRDEVPRFGVEADEIGPVNVVLLSRAPLELTFPELAQGRIPVTTGEGPEIQALIEWPYYGSRSDMAWPFQAIGIDECADHTTATIDRVWAPVGAGDASAKRAVLEPPREAPSMLDQIARSLDIRPGTAIALPFAIAAAAAGLIYLAFAARSPRSSAA